MDKNRAVILDDDDALRDTFVAILRRRGFDAEGYPEAEKLLAEVFDASHRHSEHPDIVVVDLQLNQGKMQGMDLIKELVSRDVPSEILAVTGNLPTADLLDAMIIGASDWMIKPYDFLTLMPKLTSMAQTGKKRRLHRKMDTPAMDMSRMQRPVFLSYSDHDRTLANVIKRYLEARDIGVWYAPTTLRVGDPWQDRIAEGLKEAKIFVALLTDSYFTRPYCIDELIEFDHRARTDPEPKPLFLPLTSNLSEETIRNPTLKNIRNHYQCRDISRRQFLDGLTDLLLRIQDCLAMTGQEEVKYRATA